MTVLFEPMAQGSIIRIVVLADDDPRHGTENGYGNLGCRCAGCRAANAARRRNYLARVRANGRILGKHGTEVAYDSGCRCDECRNNHNAKANARYRARRRKSTPKN